MYLIFIFALPFSALLLLNGFVVVVIKRAEKFRYTLSRRTRKIYSTATMMIAVNVAFVICNALAFIINAIEAAGSYSASVGNETLANNISAAQGDQQPWFYFLIDLSNLLVMMHCTVNFFIYFTFSKTFQNQCLALFKFSPFSRCALLGSQQTKFRRMLALSKVPFENRFQLTPL